MTSASNQNYAGFWRRFAAYVLDMMILAYVISSLHSYLVARIQVSLLNPRESDLVRVVAVKLSSLLFGYEALGSDNFQLILSAANRLANCFILPAVLIFVWCYFSGMESSPLKATFGKFAVGLYVTDSNGNRISFGRATGRFFGKFLSGLILSIGYLLAGFTKKKQALHDLVAGCLVLRR